jgi:ribosome-associated toxin RatA of RatAB toxin-antitoxin module
VKSIRRKARVPYTAEQMFDLVNDVAAYSSFLPWCRSATVHSVSDTELEATLDVGVGALHKRFSTRNTLSRPNRIELALVDGPFRQFSGCWRFDAVADVGCDVSLDLDFEVASRPLKLVFERAFEELARSQLDAFLSRAKELYD